MEGSSANESFIQYDKDHHFPIQNIPFGAFMNEESQEIHCCTRIGDAVIDLAVLEGAGKFDGPLFSKLTRKDYFKQKYLNDFIDLGKEYWHEARTTIQKLFSKGEGNIENDQVILVATFEVSEATLTIPIFIRDYTDFYSSKNHAYNMGCMLRGPENALAANWLHIPIGYHGRASSIVVSGRDIRRPKGQVAPDKANPQWSDCKRLDIEIEMGTVVGKTNQLGTPVKMKEADDHIFGYCILNDWSARDLQAWEYIPLGPFNAKNFASTISPWIITTEALAPFKVKLPAQEPVPLPYLQSDNLYSYDVELEFLLKSEKMEKAHQISTSNMKHLYWSPTQQLVHHTCSGCNLSTGDLLGSGTISGTEKQTFGSLMELCWAGKEPITLPSGETRTFLVDGDEVTLRGFCKGQNFTIGFGEAVGKILPALSDDNYW